MRDCLNPATDVLNPSCRIVEFDEAGVLGATVRLGKGTPGADRGRKMFDLGRASRPQQKNNYIAQIARPNRDTIGRWQVEGRVCYADQRSRMKRLIPLLAAAFAYAQSPPPFEIRGTVVEGVLGLAGATITLYQVDNNPTTAAPRTIFATTSTDQKGAFQLHPAREGDYYIEVEKEGYVAETLPTPKKPWRKSPDNAGFFIARSDHKAKRRAPQTRVLRALEQSLESILNRQQ